MIKYQREFGNFELSFVPPLKELSINCHSVHSAIFNRRKYIYSDAKNYQSYLDKLKKKTNYSKLTFVMISLNGLSFCSNN